MKLLALKLLAFWMFVVWTGVANDEGWPLWTIVILLLATGWVGLSTVRQVGRLEGDE